MNDETSIHDFKKVGNTYFTSNQKRGRSSMSDIDCRHWIRGKCTYHNCLFRHDPAQRGRLINERHKEKSDYFDSKESNLYSAPYSSCSIEPREFFIPQSSTFRDSANAARESANAARDSTNAFEVRDSANAFNVRVSANTARDSANASCDSARTSNAQEEAVLFDEFSRKATHESISDEEFARKKICGSVASPESVAFNASQHEDTSNALSQLFIALIANKEKLDKEKLRKITELIRSA
jgi:hypothetical protein